jgi:hypothetical protein
VGYNYRPNVVVKFRDDVKLPYDDRADRALEEEGRGEWQRLKAQFPGISIRKQFNSVTTSQIRVLVAKARRRQDKYRPPNFLTYFVIDLPARVDANELVKSLLHWRMVETAYLDPPAEDPVVTNVDPRLAGLDPRMAQQGYLRAAPDGIDAEFAWGHPGGDGSGQHFIDLEQGWTRDHEDLVARGAQVLFGVETPQSRPHGTSVLGVVCAVANQVGCRGIAHSVASAHVVSHSGNENNVANAILAAINNLESGGILLLEVQRPEMEINNTWLPTEFFQADFQMIEMATAIGITVVEAAGNSGHDLDTVSDRHGKRAFVRGVRDSRAILVGGASSGVPHVRLDSNFGSRVDCYAWGEDVVAPTSSDSGPVLKKAYRDDFNGTSSAAAIIAGAALVVQGVAVARHGKHLSPMQMRRVLSDPATGTNSGNPAVDRIGVMPNLRAIINGNAIGQALTLFTPVQPSGPGP